MKRTFLALLGGALLMMAGCGGGGGGGGGGTACTLSGTLSAELDLNPARCSSYRVVGDLSIADGGKLVAPPGTILVFDQDTGIFVSGHGALVAEGGATDPVVFKGAAAIPGYWKGIVFTDADSFDNKLIHVEVRDAAGKDLWDPGAFETFRAAVVLWGQSRLRMRHARVWKNDGAGVFVDEEVDLYGDFSGNTITENQGYPLLIYASRVAALKPDGDFSGNAAGHDFVRVAAGSYGAVGTGTWRRLNVPYRLFGDVTIADGATLTIEAGAVLVFEQDGRLTVSDHTGALTALGTASAPITFTGLVHQPGYWCGLYFHDTHGANNRLAHVVVEYGGGDAAACTFSQSNYQGNILIDSSGNASSQYLYLHDSIIRNSRHYGIVIADTATTDFAGNTFANNADGNQKLEHY